MHSNDVQLNPYCKIHEKINTEINNRNLLYFEYLNHPDLINN